jgi:hypothetical protein
MDFVKNENNIFDFKIIVDSNNLITNTLIIHQSLKGKIDINKFLKEFFSNALIPIFQNRSTFIENSYLNGLQYDTVLINFFALKVENFQNCLIPITKEKFIENKIISYF